MRMKLPGVLMAVFALLGAEAPAFAHHQFGVEFDAKKCMDLKGTLAGIDWENPHAYVHIDVKDASGKTVTWSLEMITPNALKKERHHAGGFPGQYGQARHCMGLSDQVWWYAGQRCGGIPQAIGRLFAYRWAECWKYEARPA